MLLFTFLQRLTFANEAIESSIALTLALHGMHAESCVFQ